MSEHRHWREECGVVGIAGVKGAAELASLALHALQHRGQESAGITVADGLCVQAHKRMGMVAVYPSRCCDSFRRARNIEIITR